MQDAGIEEARLIVKQLAAALILVALVASVGALATACGTDADRDLLLATTTSTEDSGLLDVLLPMFEDETGYDVKPIAVGSGAALAMAQRGDVDVLLVHDPDAEEDFVADGFGIHRTRVMYNDFVLVGPPADPAGIEGVTGIAQAMRAVAAAGGPFFSRGDGSGTHATERALWAAAGLDVPAGEGWYAETGQGMGATLTIAGESQGYALTDRATWLAAVDPDVLAVLAEGDERLFNVYHVIVVDPDAFPSIDLNTAGAQAFRDFLVGDAAQEAIATFGLEAYGMPLFVPHPPDAAAED